MSKLHVKIENEKSNNSFLHRVRATYLRDISTETKRPQKRTKNYQFLKRYDSVQIRNTVKLIYPVAEGSSSIKY